MKQLFVNSMLFMFFVLYLGISYGTLEERREERLVSDETTASTMSHLEGIINNQVAERSGQQNYGIELFIVIDYSIYHKWYVLSSKESEKDKKEEAIQNIKYFYTHIVHGINERYKTINEPDMKFYVKCVGYFIAQTPGDAPFTENRSIKYESDSIYVYKALDEFILWVEKMSKSPVNPLPKFDSAALFTSYKMSVEDRYITGLAEIGHTCYLTGVSISKEQLEYATIQTSAHEIGHNLGAQHDGFVTFDKSQDDTGHKCEGDSQYIMASNPGTLTNKTFFNTYKFSSCSLAYFRRYIAQLDRLNTNCLKNVAHDADPSSTSLYLQSYPGQKYSVDMQCKLLYGPLSYYCAGGGKRNEKICKELVCYNPERTQCEYKIEFRAVQGTHCGNKKWCIKSTCVYDQKAPEANEGRCIYGDYKAIFKVMKKRNTCVKHIRGNPTLCYNKHYREMCCESCSKFENRTFIGCEYGDKGDVCASITDGQCYDNHMNEYCCSTCKQREVPNAITNCRYGDKVPWCDSKNARQCYQSDDLCCQTCAGLQIKITGCKYGDKIGGCTSDHCASSAHKADCCYTCRSYIPPVTTTTTMARLLFPKKCPRGDIVGWCGTLHPGQCYGSNDVCCQTCLQYFDAKKPEGCKYGDRAIWCLKLPKLAKECRSEHIAKSCCHSCKLQGQLPIQLYLSTPPTLMTSKALDVLVDKADWCKNFMWIGYCYQPSTEETCAATCDKHRNDAKPNCKYGDMYNWCDKKYCSTKKKECCVSCA